MKVNTAFLDIILTPRRSSSSDQLALHSPKSPTLPGSPTQSPSMSLSHIIVSNQPKPNSFQRLYTSDGFSAFKKWFLQLSDNGVVTEIQFVDLMRKLTDFADYEILHIFDA